MDFDLYLQQLENLVLSRSTNPPYVVLFAGLLIALTSGIAFSATLQIQVDLWHKTRNSHSNVPRWEKLKLLIPFGGTIVGFCLFLGSSLEVFGMSPFSSWTISLLLSAILGTVVWLQIGKSIGKGVLRSYLDEAFKLSSRWD